MITPKQTLTTKYKWLDALGYAGQLGGQAQVAPVPWGEHQRRKALLGMNVLKAGLRCGEALPGYLQGGDLLQLVSGCGNPALGKEGSKG
mgnify:CR=1 FL=1